VPDIYNSVPITSCCRTIAQAMGVDCDPSPAPANSAVIELCQQSFEGRKADRALIYNPDAIALWLYQRYTSRFIPAMICSQLDMPMLSVMPSVTPVCFASMYTGLLPEEHGIRKYIKPILKVDTLFDFFVRAGKRCAIVSTTDDSVSMIFLEREMDYFIYDTVEEITEKALQLIAEDSYDLIVVYHGNYDSTMHKYGTQSTQAISALEANISDYRLLVDAVHKHWKSHDVIYGFLPDHGCHDIDAGCGSHGLDMEEDMNIIHFYGAKPREDK